MADQNASPPEPATSAGARPRRGGLIALGIVVAVVLVLGVAAVIAESIARQQAASLIADQVRTSLQLEADHPVDVQIEGPPVLFQLATGSLERVTVEAARVAFGDLVGDLTLIVVGTPLDSTQPTESVQAVYRVAEADVASLAGFLAGTLVTDVQLDEREIRFQTSFSLFGVDFEVGLGVQPTIDAGELVFNPTSVVLNGERLDVTELRSQFGPLVEPLFAQQRFCVAQYLPEALAITAVQVGDEQLLVVFTAERVALSGPEFSTLGTCS